jgi:hypothetical protein
MVSLLISDTIGLFLTPFCVKFSGRQRRLFFFLGRHFEGVKILYITALKDHRTDPKEKKKKKKIRVEMEVDKEPMDLSNSSRTSLATTELVDSPIFTTFYFVFCVFSFLLYLYCITPRSSH